MPAKPRIKVMRTRKSRQGFPRRLLPLRCICLDVFLRRAVSNAAAPTSPLVARLQRNAGTSPVCRGQRSPMRGMLSPATTLIKQRCCPNDAAIALLKDQGPRVKTAIDAKALIEQTEKVKRLPERIWSLLAAAG